MITLHSLFVPSCVYTYVVSKGRQFVTKYFIGFSMSFLFRILRRIKSEDLNLVLCALIGFGRPFLVDVSYRHQAHSLLSLQDIL